MKVKHMTHNASVDFTAHPVPDALNGLSRRNMLSWATALTAGSVSSLLSGCGPSSSDTVDTLVEPPVLTAVNNQISMDLSLEYAKQSMRVAQTTDANIFPSQATWVNTSLRRYNGAAFAPTLRLRPGDTLKIQLINRLPTSPTGQSALRYLNNQNATNLHFHGLHVDPREIRAGVFGDYVVDTPLAGVMPGEVRQHEVAIPANHSSGIFWYHPHLHGSSGGQVSSGMFGAILIDDPTHRLFDPEKIRERVIFVHKLNLNSMGKTDSFYDSLATASAFMLNGVHQPTMVMRPGEVQVWHFINSATFFPFNPVLDGHTMQAFARDGDAFSQVFRAVNATTAADFSVANWPSGMLYPGNRLSVFVKASDTPGDYFLRSLKAPQAPFAETEEVVARVRVEGTPVNVSMPAATALPTFAELSPITDVELASGGGKTRSLILAVLDKTDTRLPQPLPTNEEWFVPVGDGADFFADLVFVSGDNAAGSVLAPFQSPLATSQTVTLNDVEEWTIYNPYGGYPHPFHIHVNDSYVVKVNGTVVTPYWADTLPVPVGGSITFRMRFADFKGKLVWHCHALDHEDLGMMQLVEIV